MIAKYMSNPFKEARREATRNALVVTSDAEKHQQYLREEAEKQRLQLEALIEAFSQSPAPDYLEEIFQDLRDAEFSINGPEIDSYNHSKYPEIETVLPRGYRYFFPRNRSTEEVYYKKTMVAVWHIYDGEKHVGAVFSYPFLKIKPTGLFGRMKAKVEHALKKDDESNEYTKIYLSVEFNNVVYFGKKPEVLKSKLTKAIRGMIN